MGENKKIVILGVIAVLLGILAIGAVVLNRNQQQTIGSQAASSSSSKLGIFIQGNNADAKKILDAGPKVAKILVSNPNAMLVEEGTYNEIVNTAKSFKSKYPNSKTLIRFYMNEQGQTPLTDSIPADDAAEIVFEQYEPLLKKLRDKGDIQYFDYIAGPTNETERVPLWTSSDANMYWLARFWDTLTKLNSYAGIKTCAGNILTGDMPTSDEAIKTLKAGLIPTLNSTGGVFCYHGYSDKDSSGNYFSKSTAVQEEHPLAYRTFYEKLGANTPQMIIGELGIAGGWSARGSASQYEDWLAWYDSEIKQDSEIIGATVYQVGGGGTDAIDGPVTNWFVNYLKTGSNDNGTDQSCFNSCYNKSGNGSGCTYICENTSRTSCFNSCVNQGKSGANCIRECSGNTTITPTPTQNTGGKIVLEDTSSSIEYFKTWDTVKDQSNYSPRAGSFKQCRKVINADCTAEVPKKSGVYFDQITVGFPTRPNGSTAEILVDGSSLGTINQTTSNVVGNYQNYKPWVKSVPCGTHDIEFVPNWQSGQGNLAFAIDYIELRTCTPTGTVTPTPVGGYCQGNKNAPPKCFSCFKDNPTDQVNILDFTCFRNRFGQPTQ